MEKQLLIGKRVLVTGASKGLGREICLHFAKHGAQVAFTYSSDDSNAEITLNELIELSPNLKHKNFKVDCTNLEQNISMAEELKVAWDGLDILVNNAGISGFLPLALMDESDWDKILNINLKGTYATTKALLPLFVRQKKGNILNMSSLAGVRILAAPIHYCSSKAALKGFTESLSKEIGRYNVQVNCLAPGILEAGVARGIPPNKLVDYLDQLALKRVGTFTEAAEAAAFMVSDSNSYMSGHTLIIEGGL